MWVRASRPNLRRCPDIFLEGLRKTMEVPNQDSRTLGRSGSTLWTVTFSSSAARPFTSSDISYLDLFVVYEFLSISDYIALNVRIISK
jgi:hypothetical protein